MASPSKSNPHNNNPNSSLTSSFSSLPASFDPNSSPNTTFVEADPSNFPTVVQRLTGATQHPSAQKLPVTLPARNITRRPAFKLHERRQNTRKLEIKLNNAAVTTSSLASPNSSALTRQISTLGLNGEMVMVSPVSPLDFLALGSPRTPMSPSEEEEEEEERAIAEKGFYLHPSPLSTPRGCEPPELLPLFPLHSPRNDSSSSS